MLGGGGGGRERENSDIRNERKSTIISFKLRQFLCNDLLD